MFNLVGEEKKRNLQKFLLLNSEMTNKEREYMY